MGEEGSNGYTRYLADVPAELAWRLAARRGSRSNYPLVDYLYLDDGLLRPGVEGQLYFLCRGVVQAPLTGKSREAREEAFATRLLEQLDEAFDLIEQPVRWGQHRPWVEAALALTRWLPLAPRWLTMWPTNGRRI